MHDDDSALLDQAAGGNADALRSLLERYGGQVWTEINAEIGARWRSTLDADDVMQVSYVEAFLQLERLTIRDGSGFVSWLRRIAHNNLRDAIKELQRKKRPDSARRVGLPTGDDSCVALVDLLGTTHSTPSRQVARQEAAAAVHALLERLPPDYACVIRLYDLEGREIADVAAALGRSSGAIHMLRARAHDRLRDLIGAETDFFSHPA